MKQDRGALRELAGEFSVARGIMKRRRGALRELAKK